MPEPASTIDAPPPSDKPTVIPEPAAGEKPPEDFMGDIVGELSDLDQGKPMPERDDRGKFKSAGEKPPADKSKSKPAAKPDATKPPEGETKPPEGETKPPEGETEPAKPVKAAAIREAYDGLKKKVEKELQPEIQRLRSKVQELETKGSGEIGEVRQKLETAQKENGELRRQLAYHDYTQDEEFRKKFAEPYEQAWADAVAEFRELTVRDQDGTDDLGDPKYKVRPADENDLLRLANMKLSEMDEEAQKMFGASAARAVNHVQNIRRLSAAQSKALKEAETRAVEWKKQNTEARQKDHQERNRIWDGLHEELTKKFPKAYTPNEGDEDDGKAFTKGFALADLLFLGHKGLTEDQIESLPKNLRETVKEGKRLSTAQQVQLHALARLKMANHDRQLVTIKKLRAEVEELKKSLGEYEKSEPHGGKPKDGIAVGSKAWDEQVSDELQALDRKDR